MPRTIAEKKRVEARRRICTHCARACVKYVCELCGKGVSSPSELYIVEYGAVCPPCYHARRRKDWVYPQKKLSVAEVLEQEIPLCEDYAVMPQYFPVKKEK